MHTHTRLKVEMAIRVRNFLRANSFGEAKADAIVARFEHRVNRAETLMADQKAGTIMAKSSRSKRAEVRFRLRKEPLRHLIEIAKAAEAERPGLADQFRVALGRSERDFRSAAGVLVQRATEHKDVLIEFGMRATLIDEMTALLAEYDQAVSEADGGRRAHTGARVELQRLSSELVKMVHQLNGMMVYRIRETPELGGAWDSARNVAWPIGRDAGAPADHTEPPTGPTRSAA